MKRDNNEQYLHFDYVLFLESVRSNLPEAALLVICSSQTGCRINLPCPFYAVFTHFEVVDLIFVWTYIMPAAFLIRVHIIHNWTFIALVASCFEGEVLVGRIDGSESIFNVKLGAMWVKMVGSKLFRSEMGGVWDQNSGWWAVSRWNEGPHVSKLPISGWGWGCVGQNSGQWAVSGWHWECKGQNSYFERGLVLYRSEQSAVSCFEVGLGLCGSKQWTVTYRTTTWLRNTSPAFRYTLVIPTLLERIPQLAECLDTFGRT